MAYRESYFACFVTCVLMALSASSPAGSDGSQTFDISGCPDGWHDISAQLTGGAANTQYRCLKLFSEPDSFPEALAQCRRHKGFLVSINDVPVRALRAYADSVQGKQFWTGLHKVNNKFYWDGVTPLELVNYPSICPRSLTDYGWGCEGVLEDDCASAKFTADNTTNSEASLLEYTSKSCRLRLPYFCYSIYTVNYTFIKDPVCGGSWMYNSYDDLSYKFFGSRHFGSFERAYKSCTAENALFPNVRTVNDLKVLTGYLSDQHVERVYIGQVIHDGVLRYSSSHAITGIGRFLSGLTNSSQCGVLKLTGANAPAIEFTDCFKRLTFVCKKSCINRRAAAKLTFSPSNGELTCTTASKFRQPVFWTRNGQFLQAPPVVSGNDRSVSIAVQGTRASFRCGIFDDLDPSRRVWSNVLVVHSPQDSTVLYRTIMTFNVSYDRGLLKSVYFIEPSTLAPYQWITNFFIALTRTANASSFGAQLINISRAPSGALVIYLQLYLQGKAFGARAPEPAAFYPTVKIAVEHANQLSPVAVIDIIVRDPFYCFPLTLVDPATKRPVDLPKTLAIAWASARTCGRIGTIACIGNFTVGAYWDTCASASFIKDDCGSGI